MKIHVYEIGHTDYASMGMGSITPTECNVHEEQGGAYELNLTHPMDERLTYDLLMNGRVIRVPVPQATTPMYAILTTPDKEYWKAPGGGTIYSAKSTNIGHTETVTKERSYQVLKPRPKVAATRPLQRPAVIGMWPPTVEDEGLAMPKTPRPQYTTKTETYTEDIWVPGDSSVLANVGANGEVLIASRSDPNWYRVSTLGGTTGWMQSSQLVINRIVPGVPSEMVQGKKIRDQLFRIYRVEKDTARQQVRAWARHISYDLIGNVVMAGNQRMMTLYSLLSAIKAQCSQPGHGFELHTDQPAMVLRELSYRHKNIIEALMDPDDGILAKGNLRLVRDNYDLYLTNATQQQRAPITYGRNLIGVQLDINEDAVVNRIIPLGQNKNGDPVEIAAKWIDSPRNTDDTIIRARAIEYSEARERAATEGDPGMSIAQVRAKLVELANLEYDQGIDLPDIDMKIDFLQLGDTEEYRQYRDLDRLYLADLVQITDLVNGIDVAAEVTEYDYDCLTGRYTKLGVGVTEAQRSIGSIGSYMLPDGSLGGRKLVPGSVDGSRISYMSIGATKIGLAAIQSMHVGEAVIEREHVKQSLIDSLKADAIEAVKARIQELVSDEITTDEMYAALADIAVAQLTTANIDQANILWGDIENLRSAMLDAFRARIEYLVANNLVTDELYAALAELVSAKIGTAEIDWAKIKGLVAGQMLFTEGSGGKLYVADLAVTEANMLSLTVGELVVKGADGRFYTVGVDGDGQMTTTLKQIDNPDVLDGSIHGGEKLVEGSVTASVLNAVQIFGDSALIQQLMAENLAADVFFSREGVITQLGAMNLVAINDSIRVTVENMDEKVARLTQGLSDLEGQQVETDQYIKLGLLYVDDEGVPRVGMAIGESLTRVTDAEGNLVLERSGLAQTFTSDRQTFWRNGVPVGYFANDGLYTRRVNAEESVTIGDWVIDVTDGIGLGYAGGDS